MRNGEKTLGSAGADSLTQQRAPSRLRYVATDLVFTFMQTLIAVPTWAAGLSVASMVMCTVMIGIFLFIAGPRDIAASVMGEHFEPKTRRTRAAVTLIVLVDFAMLGLLGFIWPFEPGGWGSLLGLACAVFVLMRIARAVVRRFERKSDRVRRLGPAAPESCGPKKVGG